MKNILQTGIAIIFAAVCAASSAFADITATTGDISGIPAPVSVDLDALDSEDAIFIFREQAAGYVLPGDIDVNISQPGTYHWTGGGAPTLTPATLLRVCWSPVSTSCISTGN